MIEQREIKLHSRAAVTLATVIGLPIAGCILLAQNYQRLGNTRAARNAMAWGASTSLLLLAVGFILPDSVPHFILPLAYTIAMYNLASAIQGSTYSSHITNGGARSSLWMAVGVGFLCLFVVLGILFVAALLFPERS